MTRGGFEKCLERLEMVSRTAWRDERWFQEVFCGATGDGLKNYLNNWGGFKTCQVGSFETICSLCLELVGPRNGFKKCVEWLFAVTRDCSKNFLE